MGPALRTQLSNIPGPAINGEVSSKKWITLPSLPHNRRLASGLAVLDTAPRSIAVDPKMFSPYSRKNVLKYLNLIFWSNTALSIASGALLWINGLFGLGWSIAQGAALFAQGATYCKWVWDSRRKARRIRREDFANSEGMEWMAEPAGPPPSFDEDRAPISKGEIGDWYEYEITDI